MTFCELFCTGIFYCRGEGVGIGFEFHVSGLFFVGIGFKVLI